MSARRHERVAALFAGALLVPAEERRAWLAERCASDAELLREVEELLAHDARAGDAFATQRLGGVEHVERLHDLLHEAGRELDARAELTLDEGRAPSRIGPYRVLGVLGAGGWSVVYRALQEQPRREIALKVLRWDSISDAERVRFEREAAILAALRHPGIVQVLEGGVASVEGRGRPYIAMELVEGETLRACLAREGWPREHGLRVLTEVCAALQHAHERGVVHRDLKPQNIVVDRAGHARVLDFGAARWEVTEERDRTRRTGAGDLLGTLAYMSPEQARGEARAADARSDLYSLGVMLHELVAGEPPFDLHDVPVHEAVRRISEDRPRSLNARSRGWPVDVERIVARLLARDPALRYASARDVAADLERVSRGEPVRQSVGTELRLKLASARGMRWPRTLRRVALMALVSSAAYGVGALVMRSPTTPSVAAAERARGARTPIVPGSLARAPRSQVRTSENCAGSMNWARKGCDAGATYHVAASARPNHGHPRVLWRKPELTDCAVLAGDLDGDGACELVTMNAYTTLQCFDGAGFCRWTTETGYLLCYVADLDLDGECEILLTKTHPGQSRSVVVGCNSHGRCSERTSINKAPPGAHMHVLGQVDDDLLVGLYTADGGHPRGVARLSLTTQREVWSLMTAGGGAALGDFALGDIDANGLDEIALPWITPNNLNLIEDANDGELFTVCVDVERTRLFQEPLNRAWGSGENPLGVLSALAADLHHCGRSDLFAIERHDESVGPGFAHLHRLAPDGSRVGEWLGPENAFLHAVVVRDHDGDGVDDLALSSNAGSMDLAIVSGATLHTLFTWPHAGVVLASADLDGDGADELVVYRPAARAVAFLSPRTRTELGSFEIGERPTDDFDGQSRWAIADLDGNGVLEVAIAASGGVFVITFE